MIIFTGAPTMTMCPTGNPTDALGVIATADAPDGASPPSNTGEARDNATITENDTSNSSGGVEEFLILKVESLQRKIFKECCFVL